MSCTAFGCIISKITIGNIKITISNINPFLILLRVFDIKDCFY